MTSARPPAGWYPSPGEPGRERRWDGAEWTDERRGSIGAEPLACAGATRRGLREHQVMMLVFGAIFLLLVLAGIVLPLMVFR